jgi:hypothetical protein
MAEVVTCDGPLCLDKFAICLVPQVAVQRARLAGRHYAKPLNLVPLTLKVRTVAVHKCRLATLRFVQLAVGSNVEAFGVLILDRDRSHCRLRRGRDRQTWKIDRQLAEGVQSEHHDLANDRCVASLVSIGGVVVDKLELAEVCNGCAGSLEALETSAVATMVQDCLVSLDKLSADSTGADAWMNTSFKPSRIAPIPTRLNGGMRLPRNR